MRALAAQLRACGPGLLAACVLTLTAACGSGGSDRAPPAREWQDPGEAHQGEWTLYWSAYPTADLDPAMAAEYGVEQRPRGALVTVSLVRDLDPRASAGARVEIAARTLLGDPRPVRVRSIERDGVVSWLGELDVQHREMLVFSVSAHLPTQPAPFTAEFRREFYVRE